MSQTHDKTTQLNRRLENPETAAAFNDEWRERAAIMEFDGKVKRKVADRLARAETVERWVKEGL